MPEAASARLGLIAPSDAGDALTIWPDQAQAMVAALDAKTAIFGTGGRPSRPRSTPVVTGIPGQVYRSTGDGGIDYDTGTSWVTVKPGLFTSLPTLSGHASDGIDEGMEILFQTAGMVTDGVPPYLLRYDSTLSGTSKWAVVSAQPWIKQADAAAAIPTTLGDFSGGQPSFALPAPGDYTLRVGAYITVPATAEGGAIFPVATGLAAALINGVAMGTGGGFIIAASVFNETVVTGISGTLKLQGNASLAGNTAARRLLSATPRRLG